MSIVNRDHNFIYLKSHKTASTTIEINLILNSELGNDIYYTSREILKFGLPRAKKNRTILRGQSIKWFDLPAGYKWLDKIRGARYIVPALTQHDDLMRIYHLFGNRFCNKCYKVTSVRNPWDALVSFYHWERSGQQGRVKQKDVKWDKWFNDILKPVQNSKYSLAQDFLFYPYIFLNDKIAVQDFIYFEDMDGSINRLAKKIGVHIEPLNQNGLHFKKGNRKEDYRTYYTSEQAEKVRTHFSKYLNVLPYKFDKTNELPV